MNKEEVVLTISEEDYKMIVALSIDNNCTIDEVVEKLLIDYMKKIENDSLNL